MYGIMQLILFALSALVAVSAAPAEAVLETKIVETDNTIVAHDNVAVVDTYSSDTCNGASSQFTVVGGGSRCALFSNVRSISLSGSGCSIRTWSGNNGGGSSAVIDYGKCTSVLYASVSVDC